MSKNRVCAVSGCNNINYYVYKNPDGVQKRFFRFPRVKWMCIKWIEKLNRLDLLPVLEQKGSFVLWQNYRVCSDHFVKEDFIKRRRYTKRARNYSACLRRTAVPSQNLGDENEIYVASTSALQLLNEEEEIVVEKVEIKDEPLPQLLQEEDLFEEPCEEVRVEFVVEPNEVVEPQTAKKPRKTAKDINRELREKLAAAQELVEKCRLERKLVNEKFEKLDRVKNRYINYHKVDSCKGKDSCDCQRDFALDLYMKSPQVYKHLQKKFLLPHTLVLYKWKLQKDQEVLQRQLELSAEP